MVCARRTANACRFLRSTRKCARRRLSLCIRQSVFFISNQLNVIDYKLSKCVAVIRWYCRFSLFNSHNEWAFLRIAFSWTCFVCTLSIVLKIANEGSFNMNIQVAVFFIWLFWWTAYVLSLNKGSVHSTRFGPFTWITYCGDVIIVECVRANDRFPDDRQFMINVNDKPNIDLTHCCFHLVNCYVDFDSCNALRLCVTVWTMNFILFG